MLVHETLPERQPAAVAPELPVGLDLTRHRIICTHIYGVAPAKLHHPHFAQLELVLEEGPGARAA